MSHREPRPSAPLSSGQLPIESILPDVCGALQRGQSVVIEAPPGAGKTTGVPPALLQHEIIPRAQRANQIWIIQPRRLAARMVAARLAEQLGESIGQTAGYHVRLDRCEGPTTRLLSMTTGMFLRRMQSDPLLERAGMVILDEFHERTLDLDVALALTHRLRTSLRDELRLAVMSATLEPGPICDYLDRTSPAEWPRSQPLSCQGRAFPVDVQYRGAVTGQRLSDRVADAVDEALAATDGHVLVFLPGLADIHRAEATLSRRNVDHRAEVVRLHGSLSAKQQTAATGPARRRRVILATNIAETSVTVPGVTAVVDSGLAKQPRLDTRRGGMRLETLPISLASADQRAGRAGRTQPGVAFRLWDAAGNRGRDLYDRPEIERGDLSDAMLTLASMGEHDLASFPWLTPPPEHALAAARELLMQLHAVDDSGRITPVGKTMASIPLTARLARFAMVARATLPPHSVAFASALLSEPDPFERGSGHQPSPRPGAAPMSLAEKVLLLEDRSARAADGLPFAGDPFSLKQLRRVAKQLQRSLAELPGPESKRLDSRSLSESLARALLAAYPDRVAIPRPADPDRGVMVGSRGVRQLRAVTAADPAGDDDDETLVLCLDVDGGGGPEAVVRAGCPIRRDWLDEAFVETSLRIEFDASAQSIRCRRVVSYRGLVLRQTPTACQPNESTAAILFEHAREHWDQIVPTSSGPSASENFGSLCERLRRVARHDEQRRGSVLDPIPPLDEDLLLETLRDLCQRRLSFEQLRSAPWKEHLLGRLSYEQSQRVNRLAPTHVTLPSGNRAAVHYEPGKPPWLAARIQECYGWSRTPCILDGDVSVQLHLLGPNRRPQQITEDLPSFWQNTYPTIRGELKRRYGRHHWPDNPATAQATANGLKPR